jgi:hypothetical protein
MPRQQAVATITRRRREFGDVVGKTRAFNRGSADRIRAELRYSQEGCACNWE